MVRSLAEEDLGLKILREPRNAPGASDATRFIDVIAIHGIGAHPDDTWTKSVKTEKGDLEYVSWLKDDRMLPDVIPHARIMRYGYESQWFGKGAMHVRVIDIATELLKEIKRYRKDCPHRPLIFIAHCFGGLVVIQSLVEAEHDPEEWPGLFKSTTGLMFFGTPFRGAEGLSQEEMILAAMREYSDDRIQGETLRILQPGNEMLQQMLDRFGKIRSKGHKISVACFFETKSSEVGAIVGKQERTSYVVSRDSGCLDLSESTEKHPLSRTHMDMHKFGSPKELTFATVKEVIDKMASQAYDLLEARSQYEEEYKIDFSLAGLSMVSQFVDRETEINQIETLLRPLQSTTQVPNHRRKVFILYGIGGIGKTQLAIEYVRRHQRRYSAVFWVDGSSDDSVKRSMTAFAAILRENSKLDLKLEGSNVDEAAQAVLGWLSLPRNRHWLLVFDNVDRDWHAKTNDQQAYDVFKYFPHGDHGSILITSRLESLGRHGKSLKVGRVDDEQARCIVENELGRSISGTPNVETTFKKLDGLPLALTLAGSLIREMGWSFSTYNEHYDKQWTNLMTAQDEYPLQEYQERGLLTTWNMSYNQIKAQNEDAACLLRLWSMLSNEDLWYELFSVAETQKFEGLKPEWLLRISVDKLAFSKVMRLILRYSLADRKEREETYSMHSVLHEWMFHTTKVEKHEEAIEKCWTGGALIASATPSDEAHTNYWLERRRLLPHASQICRRLDGLIGNESECIYSSEMFESSFILGHLISSVGKPEEAQTMYIRALQGEEKALSREYPSTRFTVNNLAVLYQDQGKLDIAEKLYIRVLQRQEETLGYMHPSTLTTVSNLGSLYSDQGKLNEAEKLYIWALQGKEMALGCEDPWTLTTVRNLGSLYRDQGKLDEAEKLYIRALQGEEKALGREHLSTLMTVSNLAALYYKQGKLGEAEKLLIRALQRFEEALGCEHLSTLNTVNNLGSLYSTQGKLDEAEKLFTRALQGCEKTLGVEHWKTSAARKNLASIERVISDERASAERQAINE